MKIINFRKFIYRQSKGNTLVEMLVYMALLSVLLVVLAEIYGMLVNYDLEYRALSEPQQEGRFMINKLTYDIQNADSVTTPASIGSESQSLVLVKSGTTYTYQLDNGILKLNDGSGNYALMLDSTLTNSINFKRIGNTGGKNSIKIDFTIESAISLNSRDTSKDFSLTVSLK